MAGQQHGAAGVTLRRDESGGVVVGICCKIMLLEEGMEGGLESKEPLAETRHTSHGHLWHHILVPPCLQTHLLKGTGVTSPVQPDWCFITGCVYALLPTCRVSCRLKGHSKLPYRLRPSWRTTGPPTESKLERTIDLLSASASSHILLWR